MHDDSLGQNRMMVAASYLDKCRSRWAAAGPLNSPVRVRVMSLVWLGIGGEDVVIVVLIEKCELMWCGRKEERKRKEGNPESVLSLRAKRVHTSLK